MSDDTSDRTVEYTSSILRAMPSMLVITDKNFIIRRVNKNMRDTLHYTQEDLIGRSLLEIISDDASSNDLLPSLFEREHITNLEKMYLTKEHQPVPVLFSASVYRNVQNDVEGAVCIALDITERKAMEEKLAHMARHDPLTNMPNRLQLEEMLSREIALSTRHEHIMALLFIDLDDFKVVNDHLGHTVGDELLKAVAKRIKMCVREEDFSARFGGDEFVVLLFELDSIYDAGGVAEKIINLIRAPFTIQSHEIKITTSIGVACFPEAGSDSVSLIKNADIAMYQAKNEGRNNYKYFTEKLDKEQAYRLSLEHALRFALDKNELHINYQPKFNVSDLSVAGMEALIRWQHPDFGLISPDTFIPLAEQTGLIVPIGFWVMQTVCRQLAEWKKAGLYAEKIAVNLSARQLDIKTLSETLISICNEYQLSPSSIELELTETALMTNDEASIELLNQLHDLGFYITIDDFGTGYSSLSRLKQLPINCLKIDRSFVEDIPDDHSDVIIVKTAMKLGESLGLDVIAEGIETEAQRAFLKMLGCKLGQGTLFSGALSTDEMTALLKKA